LARNAKLAEAETFGMSKATRRRRQASAVVLPVEDLIMPEGTASNLEISRRPRARSTAASEGEEPKPMMHGVRVGPP